PAAPASDRRVDLELTASRSTGRAGWWKSPCPDPERAPAGQPAGATRLVLGTWFSSSLRPEGGRWLPGASSPWGEGLFLSFFRPEGGGIAWIEPRPPSGRENENGGARHQGLKSLATIVRPAGRRVAERTLAFDRHRLLHR